MSIPSEFFINDMFESVGGPEGFTEEKLDRVIRETSITYMDTGEVVRRMLDLIVEMRPDLKEAADAKFAAAEEQWKSGYC